ncbi:hypothetical protein EH230_07655 [Flavobacterium columnare]|uniref:Lipoprotein n=1 Tax=Flavobacterium columnare TaxID=996 RepID=A0A437UAZ2_9FLAO|nr:hypothetical protein [Flavobacterium columnare]RVU90781.1 hypothetical protein EH230_07655 [Flavobacterium columnare]
MKKVLFLLTVFIISSCSTSISTKLTNKSYQKLNDNSQVIVLKGEDILPNNSEFIGDVKIGDTGFTTDCGYDKVITDAKNAAKNAGGNMIQLIEVKKPNVLVSSCYRIKAKIYRNFDSEFLAKIKGIEEKNNKSRLPENSDYALIHFYRPSLGVGALLGYSIKNANDSIIGRLRNGQKFVYKTENFGDQSFYAALETKEEIKINIEKGKEYFVKCSINLGLIMGRPKMILVDNHVGISEFDQIE